VDYARDEIMQLPMSGASWDAFVDAASQSTSNPNISDQDDSTNIRVLAKAFVFARRGIPGMRDDVIDACGNAIGTEASARTLAIGRELLAYVIAADLVGLPSDLDRSFRAWLRDLRTREFENRTLILTHEVRPNNWGSHAVRVVSASRSISEFRTS
jgi:hypothetical protein